jgi:uncharacterized protein
LLCAVGDANLRDCASYALTKCSLDLLDGRWDGGEILTMKTMPRLVKEVLEEVKHLQLANDRAHGIDHVINVVANCLTIFQEIECDQEVVLLAACLHDAVPRLNLANPGDSPDHSANEATNMLRRLGISALTIERVSSCIRTASWEHYVRRGVPCSTESYVLRDADLLESIGARGIARIFSFAGAHDLSLQWTSIDSERPKRLTPNADKLESPFHHFETKLLWVRELIFSSIAKEEADRRHAFLLQFVDQYTLEQNWCARLK